tara:strand:- start:50 stop:2767 length:2718 start_codon:yes stop_codon:yes gene_type:complete
MPSAIASFVLGALKVKVGSAAWTAVMATALVADVALAESTKRKQAAAARRRSGNAPRDVTVRSGVSPAQIVYGEARVSGPVIYSNVVPAAHAADISELWTLIALAYHECEDITEIWLDGDKIGGGTYTINWVQSSTGSQDGAVTGAGKYGPIDGQSHVFAYKALGDQASVMRIDNDSPPKTITTRLFDITASHIGNGITWMATAFQLGTETGNGVWKNGAPQNIRALVKGKKLYDPRKDSTSSAYVSSLGVATHRVDTKTTWEWSDNPALCAADYLRDATVGMGSEGITSADIDWDMVGTAATVCDVEVTIPGSGSPTEKRYTCNGPLGMASTHADNIATILQTMNGRLTWSGGKFRIRAGSYDAPTLAFNEDDVSGPIQIQPELTRTERFNTVRAVYIDPESKYAQVEALPIVDTTLKTTRDAGQTLTLDPSMPMVNSEYQAQRLGYQRLLRNAQQLRAVVPFNWTALKAAVGDRITLTIAELSWTNKVFVVEKWDFSVENGFQLTLRADSSSAYADPAVSDYSTRTLAGDITFAEPPVSAPSSLTLTAAEEAIELAWSEPPVSNWQDIVIYSAAAGTAFSGASELARVHGSKYRDELGGVESRAYWIRAVNDEGDLSTRNPDSDTGIESRSLPNRVINIEMETGADVALETSGILDSQGESDVAGRVSEQYVIKVDDNQRVTGWGNLSTENTSTPTSEFVIVADKFGVVDPASTGSTPIVPFSIGSGKAQFTADVQINGDLITTGTIDASTVNVTNLEADNITGDVSTYQQFSVLPIPYIVVAQGDGETAIHTVTLPGNSLGLLPIMLGNLEFAFQSEVPQDGTAIFRWRKDSVTGSTCSDRHVQRRITSSGTELCGLSITGCWTGDNVTTDTDFVLTCQVEGDGTYDSIQIHTISGVIIGGR